MYAGTAALTRDETLFAFDGRAQSDKLGTCQATR